MNEEEDQTLVSRITYLEDTIGRLEKKVFDFFMLSQLGKSLISLQRMEDLSRVFVSSVREACNAEKAALLIYHSDENHLRLEYQIGLDQEKVRGISIKTSEGMFWQILKGGEPFPIRDSSGRYRFQSIIREHHLDLLDSVYWVPLIVKNVLRGVLTLSMKRDGGTYDHRELLFISQLATQAAIAIDSAMILHQKREASDALVKQMENLSALYDVAKALNFTNDFKRTMLFILDKARGIVKAQKGSIMLLDEDCEVLRIAVVRGIDPLTERRINDGETECTRIRMGEGIAGRVAAKKQVMVIDNATTDSRFLKSDASNVQNMVCLPLVAEDKCIGVMNITNKAGNEKFTKEEVDLLTTLAGQAAVTINNANLYHLAITDSLTGLYIKRYFLQKLHDEMVRSKRYKRKFALMIADVDHFKQVNDTYGHQMGDFVLSTLGKVLKTSLREIDIPCRYGGEEFVVIFPETEANAAAIAAERLSNSVSEYKFTKPGEGEVSITISVGIAAFPEHADDQETLIRLADKALYAAKEAGRKCVRVYTPEKKKS